MAFQDFLFTYFKHERPCQGTLFSLWLTEISRLLLWKKFYKNIQGWFLDLFITDKVWKGDRCSHICLSVYGMSVWSPLMYLTHSYIFPFFEVIQKKIYGLSIWCFIVFQSVMSSLFGYNRPYMTFHSIVYQTTMTRMLCRGFHCNWAWMSVVLRMFRLLAMLSGLRAWATHSRTRSHLGYTMFQAVEAQYVWVDIKSRTKSKYLLRACKCQYNTKCDQTDSQLTNDIVVVEFKMGMVYCIWQIIVSFFALD